VAHLVHLSAIGADTEGESLYAQSKGKGEAEILKYFPGAVILRPSVVFGPEDGFFNRFAAMTRLGPVLKIAGGNTRFQPVYVDDVAKAAVMGVDGKAAPGIYELGGPEVMTLRETIEHMLKVIHRRRLVINLPFWLANIAGTLLDAGAAVTLGLVRNGILTNRHWR
jgi:NADH dehydrogenase